MPAAPEDEGPGAAEGAAGVGVVLSAGGGVSVAPAGPGVPVAGGVGEHGEVCAQAFVAGAAEAGGPAFAGFDRDWGLAGVGGERLLVSSVICSTIGTSAATRPTTTARRAACRKMGPSGWVRTAPAIWMCPSSKTPKERRHRRRAARRDRRQPRPLPHRPWAGALWRNALLPLQAPHTAGRRGSHAGRLSGKRDWRPPDGGRLVTLSSLRNQPAFGRTLTQSTSQLGRRTPRRQRLTHERGGSNATSPQVLTIRIHPSRVGTCVRIKHEIGG